jgi:hypothetical protein
MGLEYSGVPSNVPSGVSFLPTDLCPTMMFIVVLISQRGRVCGPVSTQSRPDITIKPKGDPSHAPQLAFLGGTWYSCNASLHLTVETPRPPRVRADCPRPHDATNTPMPLLLGQGSLLGGRVHFGLVIVIVVGWPIGDGR